MDLIQSRQNESIRPLLMPDQLETAGNSVPRQKEKEDLLETDTAKKPKITDFQI
jgi:hypothetical protein